MALQGLWSKIFNLNLLLYKKFLHSSRLKVFPWKIIWSVWCSTVTGQEPKCTKHSWLRSRKGPEFLYLATEFCLTKPSKRHYLKYKTKNLADDLNIFKYSTNIHSFHSINIAIVKNDFRNWYAFGFNFFFLIKQKISFEKIRNKENDENVHDFICIFFFFKIKWHKTLLEKDVAVKKYAYPKESYVK